MNVLEEANKLVSGDRQKVYGHPIEDFTKVARLTEVISESNIDPRLKHSLYMLQVKIARLLKTPDHHDSIVDMAGYVNTYAMCLEEIQKDEVKNEK